MAEPNAISLQELSQRTQLGRSRLEPILDGILSIFLMSRMYVLDNLEVGLVTCMVMRSMQQLWSINLFM